MVYIDIIITRFPIFLKEYMDKDNENIINNKINIIGYIHICQKEGWKRSYDMIMEKVKASGLYAVATEIRLSVGLEGM